MQASREARKQRGREKRKEDSVVAMRTYRDLEVFRESYSAALEVSRLARSLPAFEQYELGRQLRKAARSIPANVVEGWGKRASAAEFKRYLQISIGSCDEVRMWLCLCRDEKYVRDLDSQGLVERYNRIGAMLQGLWKQWRSTDK